MSDPIYLALGAGAFFAACLVHYAGWRRLLRAPLGMPDRTARRAALIRWAVAAAGWQVIVLVAAGVWLAVFRGAGVRGHGFAWTAPAIGLLVGTALPLQVVVMRIARSARS